MGIANVRNKKYLIMNSDICPHDIWPWIWIFVLMIFDHECWYCSSQYLTKNVDICPHNIWPWILIFVLTIFDQECWYLSSQYQNITHDILFPFSSHPCVPQISDLKYQIQCGKGSTWILRKLPRLSWWKIWSCETWSILLCNSLRKPVLGKPSQMTRVIFRIRFILPKWLKFCENLAPVLLMCTGCDYVNGSCVSQQALLGCIQKLRLGPSKSAPPLLTCFKGCFKIHRIYFEFNTKFLRSVHRSMRIFISYNHKHIKDFSFSHFTMIWNKYFVTKPFISQ